MIGGGFIGLIGTGGGGGGLTVISDEVTTRKNATTVIHQITVPGGTYWAFLTQRILTSNGNGGPNYKAYFDIDGVQVWPRGDASAGESIDDSVWVSVNTAPSFTALYTPWHLHFPLKVNAGNHTLTVTGVIVGGSTGFVQIGYSFLSLLKVA